MEELEAAAEDSSSTVIEYSGESGSDADDPPRWRCTRRCRTLWWECARDMTIAALLIALGLYLRIQKHGQLW